MGSKAELKRQQQKKKNAKSGGFESFNLSHNVYGGVKRKGYKVPTPIQRKTMPLILDGLDVVAMARTGSGKTAAFIVPMLQRLQQHVPQAGVRALILSPTRDLAIQTLKFTKELGHFTGLDFSCENYNHCNVSSHSMIPMNALVFCIVICGFSVVLWSGILSNWMNLSFNCIGGR